MRRFAASVSLLLLTRCVMQKVHSRQAGDGELFVEEVEVSGHIIDSLILPKVLDLITEAGGSFRIKRMTVGQERQDPSYAVVEVQATSRSRLDAILAEISDHGAVPTMASDGSFVGATDAMNRVMPLSSRAQSMSACAASVAYPRPR